MSSLRSHFFRSLRSPACMRIPHRKETLRSPLAALAALLTVSLYAHAQRRRSGPPVPKCNGNAAREVGVVQPSYVVPCVDCGLAIFVCEMTMQRVRRGRACVMCDRCIEREHAAQLAEERARWLSGGQGGATPLGQPQPPADE